MKRGDPLFDRAVEIVSGMEEISANALREKLGVGKIRAGQVLSALERAGVVAPAAYPRAPRRVLLDAVPVPEDPGPPDDHRARGRNPKLEEIDGEMRAFAQKTAKEAMALMMQYVAAAMEEL